MEVSINIHNVVMANINLNKSHTLSSFARPHRFPDINKDAHKHTQRDIGVMTLQNMQSDLPENYNDPVNGML